MNKKGAGQILNGTCKIYESLRNDM